MGSTTIVILTPGNLDYLKLALQSIRENSVFQHEIIVEVDGKDVATLDYLAEQTDINWSFYEEWRGVCHSFNRSILRVRTPHFFWMNDDNFLAPGWDATIVGNMPSSLERIISGFWIEPTASSFLQKDFGLTAPIFQRQAFEAFASSLQTNTCVPAEQHGMILIPTQLYLVEPFDERFDPKHSADIDAWLRWRWRYGIRNYRDGNAIAYHFQRASTNVKMQTAEGAARLEDNQQVFINKWGFNTDRAHRIYEGTFDMLPLDYRIPEPITEGLKYGIR